MLDQHLAENVRPGVVLGNPHALSCRRRQCRTVAFAARNGRQQIDAGKAFECGRHRQQFGFGKGIGGSAAKCKLPDAGRLRRMRDHDNAVGHDGVIARVGAIPFQHGELRQMQITTLAIAEHAGEFENLLLTRGQQFLGGEFRRGPQITNRPLAIDARKLGAGRMQMGLIAWRNLKYPGLDLDKTLFVEPRPDRPRDRAPRHQERLSVGVPQRRPPWRGAGR